MVNNDAREDITGTRSTIIVWGARAGVAGSILAGFGNLIHPATPLDDPIGVAEAIARNDAWFPIHLMIVIGLCLMFAGLIALFESLRRGPGEALGFFGLLFATVGVAVGLVVVVLDGVAAKELADAWARAGDRSIALAQVITNETLNFALASLFNLTFAGITFILFGGATVVSRRYPRWLGWVAIGAGMGSIGASLVQGIVGAPTIWSRILTIIGPTTITLWVVVIGILMLRDAKRRSS
jgi:hypothetical protein